jgi:hypothetical protein
MPSHPFVTRRRHFIHLVYVMKPKIKALEMADWTHLCAAHPLLSARIRHSSDSFRPLEEDHLAFSRDLTRWNFPFLLPGAAMRHLPYIGLLPITHQICFEISSHRRQCHSHSKRPSSPPEIPTTTPPSEPPQTHHCLILTPLCNARPHHHPC